MLHKLLILKIIFLVFSHLKQVGTKAKLRITVHNQLSKKLIVPFNICSRSLNSNNFTGKIPGSLGRLDNLTWLDLADNQLHGIIPTSSNGVSGLDQLVKNLHL
ncbi:hypothetical protein BHM03_00036242 [Ensete ventricosum]|nr:hypothetical protein BHM03_00036242 [Ensete ventricosum]